MCPAWSGLVAAGCVEGERLSMQGVWGGGRWHRRGIHHRVWSAYRLNFLILC